MDHHIELRAITQVIIQTPRFHTNP